MSTPTPQAMMKVLTVNVRGLNNKIKLKRVTTNLIKQRPDMVMIQETHLKKQPGPIFRSKHFGQQFHSPGASRARGAAVLLSSKVRFQVEDVKNDAEGRYISLRGCWSTKSVP